MLIDLLVTFEVKDVLIVRPPFLRQGRRSAEAKEVIPAFIVSMSLHQSSKKALNLPQNVICWECRRTINLSVIYGGLSSKLHPDARDTIVLHVKVVSMAPCYPPI